MGIGNAPIALYYLHMLRWLKVIQLLYILVAPATGLMICHK